MAGNTVRFHGHVSFRSGVATLRTAIHLLLTYLVYVVRRGATEELIHVTTNLEIRQQQSRTQCFVLTTMT